MKTPRWPIVLTYLIAFAIAVPWYWGWFGNAGSEPVFGLPRWVVVSISASVFISCLTAWVMLRHWPVEDEADDAVDKEERK